MVALTTDFDNQRCLIERVPAAALEEAIITRIKTLSLNEKTLNKILSKVNSKSSSPLKKISSEIKSLNNQLTKFEFEIKNLLQLPSNTQKNESVKKLTLNQLEQLSQDKSKVETKILELKEQKLSCNAETVNMKDVQEFFQMFSQNIKNLNPHLQKEAVWSLVRSVIVSNETITVELYGGYQSSFKKINHLENLINLNDNKKRGYFAFKF